jgi:SAM-dependent methyltransferase
MPGKGMKDPGLTTRAELGNDCVACGSARIRRRHTIPEAMFRTGDSFTYRECDVCGSLQIDTVPADLAAHYDPDRYYSFAGGRLRPRWQSRTPARVALRLNTEVYLRIGVGRGLPWARRAGIRPADRILDIGCGQGQGLVRLHLLGYRHLLGADPFLDASKQVAPGVPVLKATHAELAGRFDWVLMQHSFEHVADPRALLASVQRMLAADGRVLIRMPVAGGWAWRNYRVNWVQLDVPRHLVLYTTDGFRRLAEECGFLLEDVFYDSWAFQFWGSELVRSGEAYAHGPGDRFTSGQMTAWARAAERLNHALDGDQAGFVLRSAPRASVLP